MAPNSNCIYKCLFSLLAFCCTDHLAAQNTSTGDNNSSSDSLYQNYVQGHKISIGYGQVNRAGVAGALSFVDIGHFTGGFIASPEQLFQGRASGVQVTSANGEPGAAIHTIIRGTSSPVDNRPLFVIDGMPLTDETIIPDGADFGRGVAHPKSPLNFINASDIENIVIMKDASAAAIYGTRAAQGVVLITTKSGKGKRKQLEYSPSVGISQMTRRYDLLDRQQFLSGAAALGSNIAELDGGTDTDWQKEISQNAVSHAHNLSFSDHHKTGNYRASLRYDNLEGVIRTSAMERFTGSLNLNQSFFKDKLKLGAMVMASCVNDHTPPVTVYNGFEGDLISSTYMANPTWPTDHQNVSRNNLNPNAFLKYYLDRTEINRMLTNLSLVYNLTSDLSFKVHTGFDRSSSVREKAISGLLMMDEGVFENGRASVTDLDTGSDLLEMLVHYDKQVGNGMLNVVLGYSYQGFTRSGKSAQGWGFNTGDMNQMIADLKISRGNIERSIGNLPYGQYGYAPANIDNAPVFWVNMLSPPTWGTAVNGMPESSVAAVAGDRFSRITDELQSFFGRINYASRDRYFFMVSLRADGSTKFGEDNKYGMFPAAAFGWRISEEDFMPESFSELKLRLGYGVTGNHMIPHDIHHRRYTFAGTPEIENDGRINPPGISDVGEDNPGLKGDRTSQINAGIDFGFASGKLRGSIDAYHKNTTDMVMPEVAAQPSSRDFIWKNSDANIVNRGVELSLDYEAINNDKAFVGLGFNISYNKNKVGANKLVPLNIGYIGGQGMIGAFVQRFDKDQPMYTWFMREFTGFRNGSSTYNGDFQRYVGKSALPKYNLGINLSARYKDLDFAAFINGQMGHYIYNNTANAFFTKGIFAQGKNVTEDVLNSPESPDNAADASTLFLEKGDFLRMQNIVLGYTFNVNKKLINTVRLYASAQNLFVLTGYAGSDPEVNVVQPAMLPSLGIDYSAYPRARTFMLGLNVIF